MDINRRLKEIADLDSFLTEKNKILSDVLSKMGWTVECLSDEMKVQCPRNPDHWVPESSLSQHIEICSMRTDGYLAEEMKQQLPSSKFFYQKASSVVSVMIDKETLVNILVERGLMEKKPLHELPDIPQTIDRWAVNLTPEQRLAVYEYVVQEAKSVNKPKTVTVEDLMFDFEKKDGQGEKSKSELEILAEQRDYKRRRQSYRAKNVHITKKSYTEVMKEVIENQITYLTETRKQENGERSDDSGEAVSARDRERSPMDEEYLYAREERESHHHSRYSRSRSPSKKKKKHKHRHSRSRSRSRSRRHKKSHHKHKKSHD